MSDSNNNSTTSRKTKPPTVILGDFSIREEKPRGKYAKKKNRAATVINPEQKPLTQEIDAQTSTILKRKKGRKRAIIADEQYFPSLSSPSIEEKPQTSHHSPQEESSSVDEDLSFQEKRSLLQSFMSKKTTESSELKLLRTQWIQDFKNIPIETKVSDSEFLYYQLQKKISQDLRNWLKEKIDHYMEENPPPEPLCFFVMGSLATGLATFYSDVEMGAFIKKVTPEIVAYVSEMMHLLGVKIHFLHESDKGFRLDEASLSPIHFSPELYKSDRQKDTFQFTNQSLEGSRYLTNSPDLMAVYPFITLQRVEGYQHIFYTKYEATYNYLERSQNLIRPNYQESDSPLTSFWKTLTDVPFYGWNPDSVEDQLREIDQIAQIARSMKTVDYLTGSKNLYTRFMNQRNNYLDQFIVTDSYPDRVTGKTTIRHSTLRQRFISDINFHLNKFLNKNELLQKGTYASHLHIKKDIFRPIEQILLNYAFALGWQTNDLLEIVDLLKENHIFGITSVQKLKSILNFSSYLRLWEQYLVKDNTRDICLKEEVCSVNLASEENQILFWQNQLEKLQEEEETINQLGDEKSDKEKLLASLSYRKSNAQGQLRHYQNVVNKYKKARINSAKHSKEDSGLPLISEEDLNYIHETVRPMLQSLSINQINPYQDITYAIDPNQSFQQYRLRKKSQQNQKEQSQSIVKKSDHSQKNLPKQSASSSDQLSTLKKHSEIIVKIPLKLP